MTNFLGKDNELEGAEVTDSMDAREKLHKLKTMNTTKQRRENNNTGTKRQ